MKNGVGGLGRQQLLADGAALAGGLQGKILSLSAGSGERLPLFVLGLVLAVGSFKLANTASLRSHQHLDQLF